MMSAKAEGGDRIVVFSEADASRPDGPVEGRDARSIAHLKMLQSLSGKLNRLNDVRAIGAAIVTELRSLIEYSNCRVVVVDGDQLVPIAFRGELGNPHVGVEALGTRVGEGITGRAAATGESLLVPDVLKCDFAVPIPDTPEVEETVAAIPLRYGARVIGVIVVSKLGAAQLDGDDVRLLEVLAGHASVALENARLYEEQRRAAEDAAESAEVAESLLAFGGRLATSGGLEETARALLEAARELFDARRASFWLQDSETSLELVAAVGDMPLQVPRALHLRCGRRLRGLPRRTRPVRPRAVAPRRARRRAAARHALRGRAGDGRSSAAACSRSRSRRDRATRRGCCACSRESPTRPRSR